MKIELVNDATEVNLIVNSPDIRPFIGCGDGYVDLEPFCKHEESLVFLCKSDKGRAVFLMIPFMDGVFHCHSQAEKGVRGKQALTAARECIKQAFSIAGIIKLVGFTPESNKMARAFNSMLGFEIEGRLTKAYKKNEQEKEDLIIYGLRGD